MNKSYDYSHLNYIIVHKCIVFNHLWVKTPNGLSSWRFFEQMLYEANVVGTPGVGFGPSGEGYIRLTAFGERNDCIEAMRRIKNWL